MLRMTLLSPASRMRAAIRSALGDGGWAGTKAALISSAMWAQYLPSCQ